MYAFFNCFAAHPRTLEETANTILILRRSNLRIFVLMWNGSNVKERAHEINLLTIGVVCTNVSASDMYSFLNCTPNSYWSPPDYHGGVNLFYYISFSCCFVYIWSRWNIYLLINFIIKPCTIEVSNRLKGVVVKYNFPE